MLVPVRSTGGGGDFSGDYDDLTNKPSIPSAPGDIGAATAAQGALATLLYSLATMLAALLMMLDILARLLRTALSTLGAMAPGRLSRFLPGTIVGTSEDLPGAATEGQQWYDLDSGRLFVYTGTEWVDASPDSAAGSLKPGEVNPVYFASQAEFPDPSTNHGAIAHSHADGAMYFAHGGVWNRLASSSEIPAVNNIDMEVLPELP